MVICGATFRPDKDIPDLSGKVIFVTGGNHGIGLETIRQFAKHSPAHIYMASRSVQKGEQAVQELKSTTPEAANTPITVVELNLGSFESVKRAARSFLASASRLDILVNNAGIMSTPEGLTTDGYELQFGVNHMGHALLTELLLPTLKKTAGAGADVRVVSLSSDLESRCPSTGYPFDELKTTLARVGTFGRYGISKLANIHHSAALAARNPEITCVSLHPGVFSTGLQAPTIENSGAIISGAMKLMKAVVPKADKGALHPLWAAVSPDAKTGVYYHPIGVAGKGSKLSNDAAQRDRLWDWTQAEIRPHFFS